MEILSPSTEKYDHTGKKDLYCCQEIDEYWIVGWQKRQVEINKEKFDGIDYCTDNTK